MPDAGHGLKRVMISMFMGLLFSTMIDTSTTVVGLETDFLRVGFNLLAILAGLSTFRSANYWGISYTLGYFGGLFFFGKFFMEPWELTFYFGVMAFYILIKILRKAS